MSFVFNPFTGTFDNTGNSGGGGSPAGSTKDIQWNNSGSFAGDGVRFDPGTISFWPRISSDVVITTVTGSLVGNSVEDDTQKFIKIGQDGFPRALYIEGNISELHLVQFLNADGTSVNDVTLATAGGGSEGIVVAAMQVRSDGKLTIVYTIRDNGSGGSEIHCIVCNDNGTGIVDTIVITSGITNAFYELAFGLKSNDVPRIIFADNEVGTIRLAVCADANGTPGTFTQIIASGNSDSLAAEMGSDDKLRFIYVTSTANHEVRFVQLTTDDGSSFHDNLIDTTIGSNNYYMDMTLQSDDTARIVWTDNSQGLRYAQCLNQSGSSVVLATLDTVISPLSDQLSIVIDNSSLAHVAYDDGGGTSVYHIRLLADDGSSVIKTKITSDGGYPVSMAKGNDGFMRIWYEKESGTRPMMFARLTSADGTTGRSNIGDVATNYFDTAFVNGLTFVERTSLTAVAILPSPSTTAFTLTLPIDPGTNGYVLSTDGSGILSWIPVSSGSGDVVGPGSATDNDVAIFDGTTGKLIKDTGILSTNLVQGPASVTANDVAIFDGTTGKLIKDSGIQPGTVTVTDDTTSNITAYVLWVNNTSGNLVPHVSSTRLSFSPASGELFVGGSIQLAQGVDRSIVVAGTTTINGTGYRLSMSAGAGNGSGDGGAFTMDAGSAGATGNGGTLTFTAGFGGATSGNGGLLSFEGGAAQNGNSTGGEVRMVAGAGHGSGAGGPATVRGASGGATGNGGDVVIQSGAGNGGGTDGKIKLEDATTSWAAVMDLTALNQDRTFKWPNYVGTLVPTSGHARATAQTAANTNVLTVTTGAADATYTIHANVLVTTSTAHSFTVTVDYVDEGSNSRTVTIPFAQLAGTLITAITNVTGAGPYEGVTLTIRAKAGQNVVFKTAGTFTTVTYNVDATVVQIA